MIYQFSLQKKRSSSDWHICPECGRKTFTLYIDTLTGEPIADYVGRCNREIKCGYHYTPKQYFADNPSENRRPQPHREPPQPQKQKPLCTIPFEYIERSQSRKNAFVDYLQSLFDADIVDQLVRDYHIGATKNRKVIFWQIDTQGRCRSGKLMSYDPSTGKRIKSTKDYINWTHTELKKQNKLPEEWELTQCLFGEHLLPLRPDAVVAVVESEKSAIICSAIYPDYIWLASGGRNGLNADKVKTLQGRTVVLIPDADSFEYWSTEATKYKAVCNVSTSQYIEDIATDEERQQGADIADYLIWIRQSAFEYCK